MFLWKIEEKTFDPARQPETAEDYERLLVASPNSSMLWIKYMAFYLQTGETEKARQVAKQALKTINYRDESDRLNVWVALLNFENMYGSTESLEDTFNQATQNCDSFKVHSHLAEIFSRSGKIQVTNKTLKNNFCKQFLNKNKKRTRKQCILKWRVNSAPDKTFGLNTPFFTIETPIAKQQENYSSKVSTLWRKKNVSLFK